MKAVKSMVANNEPDNRHKIFSMLILRLLSLGLCASGVLQGALKLLEPAKLGAMYAVRLCAGKSERRLLVLDAGTVQR